MVNRFLILALLFFASQTAICAEVRMAVVIQDAQARNLSPHERQALHSHIANGFRLNGNYTQIDQEAMDRLVQDEVAIAVLNGDMSKLETIRQKYKVDVLTSVTAQVSSGPSIGPYAVASASVSIKCLRPDDAILFNQHTSAPQNHYHGLPEYLGPTEESAREVALMAAVASVFKQADMKVPLPPQYQVSLGLTAVDAAPADVTFVDSPELANPDQVAKDVRLEMGRRDKITASASDPTGRLAAIGILSVDIDLQRGRRTDLPKLQVVDIRDDNGPLIHDFNLRGDNSRYRSREIVDVAFSPCSRFVVVATEHPAVWLLDTRTGANLLRAGNRDLDKPHKLAFAPRSVTLSVDGQYLRIADTGGKAHFYRIDSLDQ